VKQPRIFLLLAVLIFTAAALRQGPKSAVAVRFPQAQQAQQSLPTITSIVDREISTIEKQIVETAEAMPEDKFNFSPESLNIPGSDYKGVRTFAGQVKHIASSNYFIWSTLTGDKVPESIKDGNGPADLRTRAEILKFLKASFALGHRAAATLTAENMLQTAENSKSPRLHLASPTPMITTDRWWNTCA
jgi:hypothetical protein